MHDVHVHGASLPALGFGTFRMSAEEVGHILPLALKTGFRHVDTAQIYGNEAAVGDALASSGVPRQEIFLTTKVWVENFPGDKFIASVDDSLAKLKTDYVDLLLLHWPKSPVPLADQIGALNALVKAGKVRHIGVSNYSAALMDQAVQLSEAPIVTNQVEYHPYLDQRIVHEAAAKHGMALSAYFAMADGKVPQEPLLREIGARYNKTAAQVVLRWLVQQSNVVALSKTASEHRLAENFAVFDFALNDQEMIAIGNLAKADGRIVNPPDLAPDWD